MTTPDAAMRERAERVADAVAYSDRRQKLWHKVFHATLQVLREQAAESAQQALGMREP